MTYESYLLSKYREQMPMKVDRSRFLPIPEPDVTEFLLNAGEIQRQILRDEYSRATNKFLKESENE